MKSSASANRLPTQRTADQCRSPDRDPVQSVVVAALTGKLPAQALRDHTVARSFYLAGAA